MSHMNLSKTQETTVYMYLFLSMGHVKCEIDKKNSYSGKFNSKR
jgi:hypothetical protein